MKLLPLLTLLTFTTAQVVVPDPRVEGARPGLLRQPLRTAERPSAARSNMPMVAARVPSSAPSRYVCTLGEATDTHPVANLKPLYGSGVFERRKREYMEAKRALLRLRQSNADYYECPYANPSPDIDDCDVVTTQIYSTGQTLFVSKGGCLVFEYKTCRAFFCSLCTALQVDSDFIGNQLNTAESLCVQYGDAASIVSKTPPQWEAGFVYKGGDLPYYAVC